MTANNLSWSMPRSGGRARRTRSSDAPLDRHALAVFEEATACGYINGEPGFINGTGWRTRTGSAWAKPVHTDGCARRYAADHAVPLLAELGPRGAGAPATTNPCGEITLHVPAATASSRFRRCSPARATAEMTPGVMPDDVAAECASRGQRVRACAS